MSLNTTNVLKNLNGFILFLFFIIFTAPLGADDVISSNSDDERRRSSKSPVAVKIISYGEMSATQLDLGAGITPFSPVVHTRSTAYFAEQLGETVLADKPDFQYQYAFWHLQPGYDQTGKQLDQRVGGKSFKTVSEFQSSGKQWIGTVISETGPPSFPDNSMSYHAGYDNNGRLPQVTRIETPAIISENIVHRIHSKTASVRTPTGPPDTPGFKFTSRKPQSGTSSSTFFVDPDFSLITRIYSRSMQAILRGDRLRMLT